MQKSNRQEGTSSARSIDRRGLLRGAFGAALLPGAGSLLLAGCGGDDSPEVVAATPVLSSVQNFRDVAGASDSAVYYNAAGQKLRRGVLYRSNAMAASTADLATLETLGLSWVYDLRTTSEIASTADVLPAGASTVNINILGSASVTTPSLTSAADSVAYMQAMNRLFVTDATVRAKFATLFTDLSNGAAAQVYHCTAGKDRTGWTSAVLLNLVGVSGATVMSDYLLSNTYLAKYISTTYATLVTYYGQAYADLYLPMLQVAESYLQAGLDQVTTSYGSMAGYVTDGLGLSTSTQDRLKAILLG
jgi:protein-tyrosine phosphatase